MVFIVNETKHGVYKDKEKRKEYKREYMCRYMRIWRRRFKAPVWSQQEIEVK